MSAPGVNDVADEEGNGLPDDVPLTREEIEAFLARKGRKGGRR